MASLPVGRYSTQREATWEGCVDVAEPAAATILPDDINTAGELDLDETYLFESFEKHFQGSHVR